MPGRERSEEERQTAGRLGLGLTPASGASPAEELDVVGEDLLDEPQVRVTPGGDLTINVQRVAAGAAVHPIRYDFDADQDRRPPLPELAVELRLPERFGRMSVHSPGGAMAGALETDGLVHRIRLRDVPLYSVALLERA